MFKVTSLNYVATMYETDGMIVYINITRGPGVTPLTRATIAITDQRSFRPSISIKYNWVLCILLKNIFKSRPHFLELNIELLLMFQFLRFLKIFLYNIFLCEIWPPPPPNRDTTLLLRIMILTNSNLHEPTLLPQVQDFLTKRILRRSF